MLFCVEHLLGQVSETRDRNKLPMFLLNMKNAYKPKFWAFFDDVMSQSELTTHIAPFLGVYQDTQL